MTHKLNPFTIHFDKEQFTPALKVAKGTDPQRIVNAFGLLSPRPALFMSGGAGGMSDADKDNIRDFIENGVARFAEQYDLTIIDGGTQSGIMQMISEARTRGGYQFPLIGVAPRHRVAFPGWQPEDVETELDAGHTHFVLVEGDEWGDESQTIIDLTRTIAARQRPSLGILINGGRIAQKDIYLSTTRGENNVPVLVIDGSGRAADDISNAIKNGTFENQIIKQIVRGGQIRLVALHDGVQALWKELEMHFIEQASS